ncbi:ATP-dependent helicase [Asanoa ishikariensis]|uniref:ATP-dependent helicase Lhr and Lhr-like helicase n=1 Tax=Asanoa ishikariensis TaxID=137265 RepID=A0A1H3UWL7_9ACTN|nr:DEAD/DEAH box helicase [Asanoa ishikariensis]GIF65220.1 ATP-dependent helicase [Asanoa ishikariensis]SDZ66676.1 ATP-dependent helicase Lhr and Lhr-like helicase [Asanoa ishikariensis]
MNLHPVVTHHLVNTLGWADLRPLQRAAVAPLLAGSDAVLVAPTAGGKTEAAVLPLLTRIAEHGWAGTSVLYLAPLKALLNNLLPRVRRYADWLGYDAALWHGDVTAARRRAILAGAPELLLTTPESLEAMLVSANVDHRRLFAGLRAVVVDEVHAFAGDDRGWHLLAILERLTNVAGRPLQRVGLSATVGNPDVLLTWLQGSGKRPGVVISPDQVGSGVRWRASPPPGDIELDHVGTLANAATVIASLHTGEKRLVFCESRQTVEELGQLLRGKGVTTFLSHASLSVESRRQAEEAFAEARDCVIVATSTLELGIDVGDLDRVIQIDAPRTVASFLQRLGRTGRRLGNARNCLLLTLDGEALTAAAALLTLWAKGWVEAVSAPPEPRHIIAQQILALCLQEARVGDALWPAAWNQLSPFTGPAAGPIVEHLTEQGFLERDGGMLFVGARAEEIFGRRHFAELTAVFTGPPEFVVLLGRGELGQVDARLLAGQAHGERRLLLGGRSWRVTHIDWSRRRCFVEPAAGGGRARWHSGGLAGLSYPLAQAMRQVLLGVDPPIKLTKRAIAELERVRAEKADLAWSAGSVIGPPRGGVRRWWTWAGVRANATLAATFGSVADGFDDTSVRLRAELTPADWADARTRAENDLRLPSVDERALAGLKFAAALPPALAVATLAARLGDQEGAAAVLLEPIRLVV